MKYIVYHGTSSKFSKFNLKKTTQGIIWFTDDKEAIEKGEVGAQGKGYILKCEIELVNPCGWNEYEKYGIGQLKSMGYDGIILPDSNSNTYIVFEPKQIKMLKEAWDNREYLSWKRKNVTIRGIQELGKENGGMGRFGSGLYTAFLSNKDMAKQYGTVYFVVGAIPKHPKVVQYANDAEIFIHRIIEQWCKEKNMKYDSRNFFQKTNIKDEMLANGYDGLVVKGREMVNYTPSNDIRYFQNENQLIQYYEDFVENKINELQNSTAYFNKNIEKLIEEIKLDIEVGDEIRTGKFRNKKVIVKKIGTDEHGSPTVNGKSILAIRIPKIDPTKKKEELEEVEEIKCKCGWKWDKSEGGKDMYVCHKCGNNNSPLTEKILREANWNKTIDIEDTINEIEEYFSDADSYAEVFSNYTGTKKESINVITYKKDFNVLDEILKKALSNGYYPAAISSRQGTKKFTKASYQTELKNSPNAILINLEKYYDNTVKYSVLYHTTPIERWKALISKSGLTPKSQSKLTTHPKRVYMLTEDGETAAELAGMLYKREKLKNKLSGEYVLLKIDMSKLPDVEVYEDPDFSSGVYTYSSIPLTAISIIDNINVGVEKEMNFNDILDMLQSGR